MKKSLVEFLEEIDSYDRLGFAGHPDDSGIRARGVQRRQQRRHIDYPYDKDVFYGQPTAYDRGSSAAGPLHGMFMPIDDEHFSLSLLDLEDIVKEVLGSPMLLQRGYAGQTGSSIPGVMGWANDPPKDWDDVDERSLTIDTSPPDVESIPTANVSDFRGQTDDDLENRLNRIWGFDDNENFVDPTSFGKFDFHVIAPDPWSVINGRLMSRGLYGLFPKESAWDRISGMTQSKREIS